MTKFTPSLQLFISLHKLHAKMTRIFDARLGGIGMTEFIILHHLDTSEEGRLRRIDLADKLSITASGITRMLAPMEKVGLVRTQEAKEDARVRYVSITASGKRKLEEALEDAHDVSDAATKEAGEAKLAELAKLADKIAQ